MVVFLRFLPSCLFVFQNLSSTPTTTTKTLHRRLMMTTLSSSTSLSWKVPERTRAVLVGSGSDGMNEMEVCNQVIQFTNKKNPSEVVLLYLGTATYDMQVPKQKQTERFQEMGVQIKSLDVADSLNLPSPQTIEDSFQNIDIIVVSGGNTLFAIDAWKSLGMDKYIQQAMERGVVLSGGSAGAICFFDSGHSDSNDPDTFRDAMLADESKTEDDIGDDNSGEEKKPWEYIHVPGLGFFPGLCCPHYDKTQSNGIPRSIDFEQMLVRNHSGERGIGIDHYAALCIQGHAYSVLSISNKPGTVLPDHTFSLERKGIPGIWKMDVTKDNAIHRELAPSQGTLDTLLKVASSITEDPQLEQARKNNPWKRI